MPRQRVTLVAVFVLLSACLPGCAPEGPPPVETGDPGRPVRGGDLLVALLGDVDSWNPYTAQDSTSAGILDLLYPRLLLETGFADGTTSFEPWLASSWQFSPDRLRLTFHLRPESRWSDGAPVTCGDVRFTYEIQVSEELAWPGAFLKERIREVDCPDDHTAVFHFTEAYPDQLLDANDDAIVPVSYRSVPREEWTATSWERRAVSCGPFRLASVRPGQEAVLERNPDWWGASGTYPDRIILRVYPGSSGPLPRFLAGDVDLIAKVPPLRAAEVEAEPSLRLVELPSLSYTFLGWNVLAPGSYSRDRRARGCAPGARCSEDDQDIHRLQREHPHPILSDARVRRALTLAIDRDDLVNGLWAGHARTGTTPIVSALWAHDPSASFPFDPERASRLLGEAGWRYPQGSSVLERDGEVLELRVIVNAENKVRRDALQRVAANLSRLGVRLIPEPLPRGEFVARARDKDFDVVLSGWWAGTRIEPQNLLHTRAAAARGNNLVSWSTPESDSLLERAEAATTRDDALPHWLAWQAIYHEEQPLTILYEEKRLLGTSRRIQGPTPSFLNPFQNLWRWWIEESPRSVP